MSDSKQWSEDKLIEALSKGGILREQGINYLLNAYIHYITSVSKKAGLTKDLALWMAWFYCSLVLHLGR
ncbi:MAG: hypothetical protein ACI9AT_001220 [Ulvibacter sp.]|jgi:hypothetical protein